MQIEVFDPAMCCSTGVCGPSVDPSLARFAADLEWLTSAGATVRRFNLGQEPVAFAENERVRALLTVQGEAALPVIFADGELRATGRFPTREELAAWASVEVPALPVDQLSVNDRDLIGSATDEPSLEMASEAPSTSCCAPSETSPAESDASSCCAPSQSVALGAKSTDAPSCC